MGGRLHEVPGDGDQGVDCQAQEDGPLGTHPAGQAAESEGARNADELRDDEGTDHIACIQPDLAAVDGGHLDDRADTVVVEPEGPQKEQQLPVLEQLAEGVAEASETGPDR